MKRGYQLGFSTHGAAMHDAPARERKAHTMVAVLREHFGDRLGQLDVLDVGASTGIIDNVLAAHVRSVHGLDIDADAIEHARRAFRRDNLGFELGDAMALAQADASFDVVICAQVYEHVPDAGVMMREILRVLRPGGVCYFAANNRLMWTEPHYRLPLLSVLPRPLAHCYVRWSGRASHYHELHFSYWGLRRLTAAFVRHDYTRRILGSPQRYGATDLLRPGSLKARLAPLVARYAFWLVPGYVWLLEKPAAGPAGLVPGVRAPTI